jgi:Inosine-uridine preferring nucleoside hydrolase
LLDTDLDSDIDDIAMLGLLLGSRSKLIAATVASNNPASAPCMRAMLDYAGYQSTPVGAYQGGAIGGGADSLYASTVRDEFRPGETRSNYTEAVTVMCTALSNAPRSSVTLVSGGTLTNIAALLRSDHDLVASRCTKIVAMGGNFADPKAQENNILFDIEAANFVASESPVPVYWAGAEVGASIFTAIPPGTGPYSRAWEMGASLLTNGKRQSWDLMAALFALRGAGRLFNVSESGSVTFDAGGRSSFKRSKRGRSRYLLKVADDRQISDACHAAIASFANRLRLTVR